MITVEDLLMAFASAYDAWLDPDSERKNPVPEYAALIRQAVNYENDTLGRGECHYIPDEQGFTWWDENDVEHNEGVVEPTTNDVDAEVDA